MFKVGDKVKILDCYDKPSASDGGVAFVTDMRNEVGKECTIKGLTAGRVYLVENGWTWLEKWLVLSNNKKNMNLKEKFAQMFLSEPEKSFRKAGITNSDGVLTDDGQVVFLSYLLKREGATFKTEVVDPILAEEEKCSK